MALINLETIETADLVKLVGATVYVNFTEEATAREDFPVSWYDGLFEFVGVDVNEPPEFIGLTEHQQYDDEPTAIQFDEIARFAVIIYPAKNN